MGEAVRGLAGEFRPARGGDGRVGQGFFQAPHLVTPGCAGDFQHAAEQAGLRPAADEPAASLIHRQEMHAVARRAGALRGFAGEVVLDAQTPRLAGFAPGTEGASGALGGADGGAEVEQGLCEIAGAGACLRVVHPALRERVEAAFGGGEGRFDGEDAGGHAFHVAVGGDDGAVEGDRGDGGGGVGADAGNVPQPLHRVGEAAARQHRLRAGVQVAGAGIVAEAGPFLGDVLPRGIRQRRHVREAAQEALVAWAHRRNGRLLQHDLGQPDAVRIGRA